MKTSVFVSLAQAEARCVSFPVSAAAAVSTFVELATIFFFFFFFGCKTEFFPFQNIPKYKMDLDLWDCLGRVKHIIAKVHKTG